VEKQVSDLIDNLESFKSLIKSEIPNTTMVICKDKFFMQKFAYRLACFIICENQLNATICQNIEKNIFPDVYYLPQNKDVILSEDVSFIIEKMSYSPLSSNYKVFILDNFEKANVQTQNKLLKSLEEPNENSYFIILCANDDSMLPTVKSRCRKIEIGSLKNKEIEPIFNDLFKNEKEKKMAKFLSKNYLGKAISIASDNKYFYLYNLAIDIITNCKNSSNVLKYSAELIKNKDNLNLFFEIYYDCFSEMIYYKINGHCNYEVLDEVFISVANDFSIGSIIAILNNSLIVIEQIFRNCNIPLIIDTVLLDNLQFKAQK